jgi:tRNA threonylcarbamoyladenosine biosynthesis protein TsaE
MELRVLTLADQNATESLARNIAAASRPGDIILLAGPLGAGKSCFARAFIRAIAADPTLEVPSPSFTLVQSYPTDPPITHADLWRLNGDTDLIELGLDFSDWMIFLIEWPDRLGAAMPPTALHVTLAWQGAEARTAQVRGPASLLDRLVPSGKVAAR